MNNSYFNGMFTKNNNIGIPRGEIWISSAVLEELGLPPIQHSIVTLSGELAADICFLSYTSPVQQLPVDSKEMILNVNKAHELGLVCGVTVDGPFERIVQELGFVETMKLFYQEDQLKQQLERKAALAAAELAAAKKAGADVLILCDDIAYTKGLYFSPQRFNSSLLPLYHKLRQLVKDTIMGFHSDGNIDPILGVMVEEGYSVFSLEPEAMDLITLSRTLPPNITLLSGLKSDWLINPGYSIQDNQDEIQDYVNDLAKGCRVILSSLCGVNTISSLNNLKQLYSLFRN